MYSLDFFYRTYHLLFEVGNGTSRRGGNLKSRCFIIPFFMRNFASE